MGLSRSGKTPTSLYVVLQLGVKAANYPLIPEDSSRDRLPEALRAFKQKLYGLTIAAERLMRHEGIRRINSTAKSIEEIATTILRELKLERHVY